MVAGVADRQAFRCPGCCAAAGSQRKSSPSVKRSGWKCQRFWFGKIRHLICLLTLLFPLQFKQFCLNFLSQLLTWDAGFHPLYFFCLYLWLCCSSDPISHCDHENFIIIIIIISSVSLIHASHLSVCPGMPWILADAPPPLVFLSFA